MDSGDFVPIAADEGLREVDRIREASGIDEDQNIAYAEITSEGDSDELIAVSGYHSPEGTIPVPIERMFDTFDVDFDRSADAEVKILEAVAKRIRDSGESGVVIRLFSERPPCDSCEGVILQFRAEFSPENVNLLVSHGER